MVELIRCHYNYIKPHQRLRFGAMTRMPAMQAGIFDRGQLWRNVFAWPLKPRTPAQATESEVGRSHSSRSNLAARRTIDPALLARVETDPWEALWAARSTGPVRDSAGNGEVL